MRISFHGAARGVTGSCHLLSTRHGRLLVDCGLFQGAAEDERLNERPFGFDAPGVDAVVLTHAHLDHVGRLPLLVRRGFRGAIHATAETRALARLVMVDAASLMRDEARRRRGARLLYDHGDVLDALDLFAEPLGYGAAREVISGVRVTLVDAGHILGSASALVESDGRRVLFSGDVGNAGKPLVRDPAAPPAADVVVMETTYGDRNHRPFHESRREFIGVVRRALDQGGNVVVPSFALERAQEILYVLRDAVERGELPRELPVYLDSPLAIAATRVYARYPGTLDAESQRVLLRGADPLHLPGLRYAETPAASRGIGRRSGGIIIAGSGMCTGGRVIGHLARELPRRDSAVVFVSFAAPGTLARRIIDGARKVKIRGKEVPVRASVHTVNGFSGHAGRDELLRWHAAAHPERTFLVHGADAPMEAMARAMPAATRVEMPGLDEAFEL